MPIETATYDLTEERERLEDEMDEVADEAAELYEEEWSNTQRKQDYQELVADGQMLEQQYVGVQWALDKWDEPEVTVGGLTAGEYTEVGDLTGAHKQAAQERLGSNVSTASTRRLFYAAAGVVDAPFVGDEIGADTRLEEKVQCVNQLSPQFMHWLEERVDDLTTPDVEGNGFGKRLEEKRTTTPPSSPSGGQS
jgi:hypothetical protein